MNNNSLPLWGPYGKKYAGVSKITAVKGHPAARFDFLTVPGVMGFDIRLPNVTLPSAYHTWEAASDLSFFTFRHELEWKDRVFADVSYARLDEDSFLVRTELVNDSDKIKNFVVNYFYSLELPVGKPFEPSLPENCVFIDAASFDEHEYAVPRPWDEQNPDGLKKGIIPDSRFSGGEGVGDRTERWHLPHRILKPFGGEKGDRVAYELKAGKRFLDPVLVARYRSVALKYTDAIIDGVFFIESSDTAVFSVGNGKLVLPPSDELTYAVLSLESVPERLELVSEGTGAVELDFFVICEKEDAGIVLSKTKNDPETGFLPETEVAEGNGFLMHSKYPGCEDEFFVRVFDENTRFRHVKSGCLEDCMSSRMSNADESFDDLTESFTGAFSRKHSDDGFFENAISHTIFVDPGSSSVRYAVVSDKPQKEFTTDELEAFFRRAKEKTAGVKLNPDGEKFALSTRILNSALLTNVVYPIYRRGEYIIHFTPGKRWDCLYTWDAGFIGLGMNELSPEISRFILDTYLSEESNPDFAFLHHGSPVPTQIYHFFEMLQKTEKREELLDFYCRLRLYYHYYSGKIRGSTTAKFRSGLLTTYDYFYSSSGMDDYPAQVAMMKDCVRDTAAPVITTATAIRFAKLLSLAAAELGQSGDIAEYSADIERFTAALNRYSWEDESGYFGYVLHDEKYEPKEIFRTKEGENRNKGLDGVYPIISGICDEKQKKAILGHLQNEKEMMSPFGISAVDQSASYYRVNGYWNGNIWFPHQWIIWKSLLDIGEADFAFEIAGRALKIWKREVEDTYYTFEMVNVTTGSGGWFHNFGGLSSPILLWAKAYYSPGTLNVGFDTLVKKASFTEDFTEMNAVLRGNGNESVILAVLKAGHEYEVTVDGKKQPAKMRTDGCVEIKTKINEETTIHIIRK